MNMPASGELAEALKVLATYSRVGTDPGAPIFEPLSFGQLLAMPPKTWLIDQVIGSGDIGMIYGQPGCGKTFVGIDLIVAACIGQPFARRFVVAQPLRIAYCAGEGVSGLPARFGAAAEHYQAFDLPGFTFFKTIPQLFEDGIEVGTIRQFVAEWQVRRGGPLDILFVDTLHSATVTADENSTQDMGRVLQACKWAGQQLGCAVLLVHHSNKSGTGERGSSSLRAAMDIMIEIKKLNDEDPTSTKAQMICAKIKDGAKWEPSFFSLIPAGESVRVWWDEVGASDDAKAQRRGKEFEHLLVMMQWMERYPNRRFKARELAEVAGLSAAHAIKILAGGGSVRGMQGRVTRTE